MSRTIGFLVGVLLLQRLATLPGPVWAGTALLLPLLWWLGPWGRLAAAVAAGFLWAWLQAAVVLGVTLPPGLEGRDLILEGRVAAPAQVLSHATRFIFDVHSLVAHGRSRPFRTRVRLSWYGRAPALRCGESWRLTVRLKRPHGFANPGGFDYEGWLYRRGIRATGYVRPHGSNRRVGGAAGYPVQRLRETLGRRLQTAMEHNPDRGVLMALALGARGDVPPARLALLRSTGTGHLLAISGLHVGLVAALAFGLALRLWSLSAAAVHRFPAPRAAAWAALGAGLLYSALAGFSIPTRRAFVMLAVIMGAVLLGRTAIRSRLWALALLVVLVLDTRSVLAPGFWLSFGAVAVIGIALAGYRRLPRWRRTLRLQAVVSLALLPAGLAAFQQASLVAPLANLIAVPWVGLLVVPLTLGGVLLVPVWPGAGSACLGLASHLLQVLWPVLGWLSELPWASWHHGAPPLWATALAVAGCLWLRAPRGLPARWLGGVLMNTAIAAAKNPVLMASAMRKGIEAGREAFLAGRMPR
ncbi:MAG: ComEC/Rec2 family competence protein, partial [Gammaproteobacteria bacterium]